VSLGRIIALSPDEAVGVAFVSALRQTGQIVERHTDLTTLPPGDVDAALCVIHFRGPGHQDGKALLRRLIGSCQVIAVLARDDVFSIVELMGLSERVVAMFEVDGLDPAALGAAAKRILTGDVFGLAKQMLPATTIETATVTTYADRGRCMARIAEFVETMRVPRRCHEAIEQCVDEMLMNALYDAPLDSAGNRIFAGIAPRTRVTLDIDQTVYVEYAFDGTHFGVSVRDAYGSLERRTILSFLYKCMRSSQAIDRKEGGAGVGLYLMLNAASVVSFNIIPKLATEVLCTFDTTIDEARLAELEVSIQRTDVTGQLALTTPRQEPGQPRVSSELAAPAAASPGARLSTRTAVVLGAVLAAIVVAALALAHRRSGPGHHVTFKTVPRGAAIEVEGRPIGIATDGTLSTDTLEPNRAYKVTARLGGFEPRSIVVQPLAGTSEFVLELAPLEAALDIETEPPGARVDVDGRALGATPIENAKLPAETEVVLTFKATGYDDRVVKTRTPKPGEKRTITSKLTLSPRFVRIRLSSEPPGARVIELPELPDASKTYTPTELVIEANREHRFMLTMPGFTSVTIPPFTPKPTTEIDEKRFVMAPAPP
jgi:hypothetical protein